MKSFDVLIVGSGPSGVQAALQCVRAGVKTGLVDIGYIDKNAPIPERPWSELQKLPEEARQKIFSWEGANAENLRAGVHLTPARLHMIEKMDEHFPLRAKNFFALQATSRGGLGAGWGANAFVFDDKELSLIGIGARKIRPYYREVSKGIGVSGGTGDISFVAEGLVVQPPLPLDTNAASILHIYERKRSWFLTQGFVLGQSLLAVLSNPLGTRRANPLFDMDYWSNTGESVYRPQLTLEEIEATPELARHFTYLSQRLALHFVEDATGAELTVQNITTGSEETLHTKKLILAAGALGSARLVLASRHDYKTRLPLLCNRNIWIAALNLGMLFRPVADARHSLAQLTVWYEGLVAQLYSYRTFGLERLQKNIPLPRLVTLPLLRLLQSAITIVNVHYPDTQSERRFVRLGSDGVLEATAGFSPKEEREAEKQERALCRMLRKLRIIPLRIVRPMHGASIHYAGTLPYSDAPKPATCDNQGKLQGTKHVYVADGSTWKFLPAKGLTFTLMANARRTAQYAIEEIKRNG